MLFGIMVYGTGTSWREEQCFVSALILNCSADPYLDADHFQTELYTVKLTGENNFIHEMF